MYSCACVVSSLSFDRTCRYLYPLPQTTGREHFHHHKDALCCHCPHSLLLPMDLSQTEMAGHFLAMFWEITDLLFSSCECLQVINTTLLLGKGINTGGKGLPQVGSVSNSLEAQNQICRLCFHSQITLDLRPKSMTYESR